MKCVTETDRRRLCVYVCACVCVCHQGEWLSKTTFRLWGSSLFFLERVLRGSKIRGATKSFLTLTHSVACLLNRVTFFAVFVVSKLVCAQCECMTSWDRVGGQRESEESDGEGRCRSHLGVRMTEGRKRKRRERQREQQMKREMSKGQVFERRKCVCGKQSLISLFISQLPQETVCFLSSVMLTAGTAPARPALWPNLFIWLGKRQRQTDTL